MMLLNNVRQQSRGISKLTIHSVYRLCKIKMEPYAWELGPFLRQCFRQVDYVAAQKLKRGQQWLRFYTQLWSRERLSYLLTQMGRRLGIAFRHRKISLFIMSGAAFVPSGADMGIENYEELKRGKATDLNEIKVSHQLNRYA